MFTKITASDDHMRASPLLAIVLRETYSALQTLFFNAVNCLFVLCIFVIRHRTLCLMQVSRSLNAWQEIECGSACLLGSQLPSRSGHELQTTGSQYGETDVVRDTIYCDEKRMPQSITLIGDKETRTSTCVSFPHL